MPLKDKLRGMAQKVGRSPAHDRSKDYADMLYCCVEERCLQSAQWARARGARWPRNVYRSNYHRRKAIDRDPSKHGTVWPPSIRAWAVSAGCRSIAADGLRPLTAMDRLMKIGSNNVKWISRHT